MTAFFWPSVSPVVTEEAGTRGGTHAGIDLAAELNDPVIAPFDGVVVFAGGDGARGSIKVGPNAWVHANGEGLTVDIRRADGLISRVGHLNGFAVNQGQHVNAGDVIGYAGSTGFSTGVHIHWETRWDRKWSGGNWVNPRSFDPQVFVSPVVETQEEEIIMATYFEATANSEPLADGTSRIWAGEGRIVRSTDDGGRTFEAAYSNLWERSDDGSIRRLFVAEAAAIRAAYEAAGRKFPVAQVHGNAIEQMYLVVRPEPQA